METKNINGNTYTKVEGGWQLQKPSGATPRSFGGEILPTVGSIGGGVLGGITGALLGPAGAFGGGVVGATVGGAAGEALQQTLEDKWGQRDGMNVGQIVGTGVSSGAFQAVGGGIVKGLSVGAKALQPTMRTVLGKLSGFSDDILKVAFERGKGVKEGLTGGEKILNDAVRKSALKVNQMAKDTLIESQKNLKEYAKIYQFYYKGGKAEGGAPGINISSLHKELGKFNLSVKEGKIIFSNKAGDPSNIIPASDRGAIQTAYNLLLGIKDNLSPKRLNDTLEALIKVSQKTSANTPTGKETKLIIKGFINKTLENIKERAPLLHDAIITNLEKRTYLKEMEEIFGNGNLTPIEVSKNTVRLLQLYNTGRLPIREAISGAKEEFGDIVGKVAGATMKLGDQFSVRASNLTKRGTIEKLFEWAPRSAIKNYVNTGKLTPELSGWLLKTSKALKISTKAILQHAVNLMENKTSD